MLILFKAKNSIGQGRRDGDDQQPLSKKVGEDEGKQIGTFISTVERNF